MVLVQDLANTVDLEMERDQLRSPGDLADFAAVHRLRLTFTAEDLVEILEFREALRDVCQAHTGVEVPAASGVVLDRLLAQAPLRLVLGTDGSAVVQPAAELIGVSALTARMAADIAAAVVDGTWPRLKACGADTCRWVYYDRSPAGRSRWCTMAICGSRNKMRQYRART
nr:CGNR zinc finger domain-containing protein [Streptomyces sp. SID13031]